MNQLNRQKLLIFFIVFINFLGYGIVFPILPLLTEKYGGTAFISGILIASFSLMQLIFTPILGKLSDRYGRRLLLIYSLVGTLISFFIMGITGSIIWLLIARIIDGISGGNISIAQAYMADITDKKNRAGAMGIIAGGISLGFVFGPLWGGLLSKISLHAPFLAASLLAIIATVLVYFFLPESMTQKEIKYEEKHFSFLSLHANKQLFLNFILSLLLFWAVSSMQSILSLYANDVFKLTIGEISILFMVGGIISAFMQGFLVSRILKKIDLKKLYFISTALTLIGFVVMSYNYGLPLFILGVNLNLIGSSLIMPLLQTVVSENSALHEQGVNMGLMQSFSSVGRIIGPLLSGFIYTKVSYNSPSIMAAIVMFMMIIGGVGLKEKNNYLNDITKK